MEPTQTPLSRIDRLVTNWSVLRVAHSDEEGSAEQARHSLVMRYAPAIRRYVISITKSETDGEELAQEVIVRLLKGDFAGADPNRGRFRDFLKTVIRNMIRNHWDRQNRRRPANVDVGELDVAEDDDDSHEWDSAWRSELLTMTWDSLENEERANANGLAHTLLRLRAEHPEATSSELAEQLSARLNRKVRADALRQKLRRARLRFAELLLAEIAHGLQTPSADDVERELIDLQIYEQVIPLLPDDWKTKLFTD